MFLVIAYIFSPTKLYIEITLNCEIGLFVRLYTIAVLLAINYHIASVWLQLTMAQLATKLLLVLYDMDVIIAWWSTYHQQLGLML